MEAKDATSILDVLTNVQTLIAFITFIVPGFISLRVYEALRGGERRNVNDAIIDVVVYSFATDIVWVPLVAHLVGIWVGWFVAVSLLGFVLFPGLLAVVWYSVQGRLAKGGVIADPTPKPWDKFFLRVAKEGLQLGVIVTLTDGRKIGGRYVDPGFVSSYPADEQIHVGETWLLDVDGAFVQRIAGSYGFLVDKKDCTTIEFFDWPKVEATLPDNEEDSDGQGQLQTSAPVEPDAGS